MQSALEWAAALCAGVVMCAAFGIIRPGGKQSAAFRMVTSAAMLCILISPLSELGGCAVRVKDFISAPSEPDNRLCRTVEEQTSRAMKEAVEGIVTRCAEEIGLAAGEISVMMDISEDGCISIGQVTVVLAEGTESDAAALRDRLDREYGLSAEVNIMEVDDGL